MVTPRHSDNRKAGREESGAQKRKRRGTNKWKKEHGGVWCVACVLAGLRAHYTPHTTRERKKTRKTKKTNNENHTPPSLTAIPHPATRQDKTRHALPSHKSDA